MKLSYFLIGYWDKNSQILFLSLIACTGGDSCCTPENKCGIDEGDCDNDNDCQDGLVCGSNNCSNKSGDDWESSDDCCYAPTK